MNNEVLQSEPRRLIRLTQFDGDGAEVTFTKPARSRSPSTIHSSHSDVGADSAKSISASWIAAQRVLENGSPMTSTQSSPPLKQDIGANSRHRKILSSSDVLQRQIRRAEKRRQMALKRFFQASEFQLPPQDPDILPPDVPVDPAVLHDKEKLRRQDAGDTRTSGFASNSDLQPSLKTFLELTEPRVTVSSPGLNIGNASRPSSETAGKSPESIVKRHQNAIRPSLESLRRAAANIPELEFQEDASSGNEMSHDLKTPSQCTPSPSPFKQLGSEQSSGTQEGEKQPVVVDRSCTESLKPIVESRRSDKIGQPADSLPRQASHQKKKRRIPITQVMQTWDSKAKKQESGAHSDSMSNASTFAFVVNDEGKSWCGVSETSEECERHRFESDAGEEPSQSMPDRSSGDDVWGDRSSDVVAMSAAVSAISSQPPPDSFGTPPETVDQAGGAEADLRGPNAQSTGQSDGLSTTALRGSLQTNPSLNQLRDLEDTVSSKAESGAMDEGVKPYHIRKLPSILAQISMESRKAWSVVQRMRSSPKRTALKKSSSAKWLPLTSMSFAKRRRHLPVKGQQSNTEKFQLRTDRQYMDPRYSTPCKPTQEERSYGSQIFEALHDGAVASHSLSSQRHSLDSLARKTPPSTPKAQLPYRRSEGQVTSYARRTVSFADELFEPTSSTARRQNTPIVKELAASQRRAMSPKSSRLAKENSVDSMVRGNMLRELEATAHSIGVPSPAVSVEILELLRSENTTSGPRRSSSNTWTLPKQRRIELASQRHSSEAAALHGRVHSAANRLMKTQPLPDHDDTSSGVWTSCTCILRKRQDSALPESNAAEDHEVVLESSKSGPRNSISEDPAAPIAVPMTPLPVTAPSQRRSSTERKAHDDGCFSEIQPDGHQEEFQAGWKQYREQKSLGREAPPASSRRQGLDQVSLRGGESHSKENQHRSGSAQGSPQRPKQKLQPAGSQNGYEAERTKPVTSNRPRLCVQRSAQGDTYEGQISNAVYSGFGVMTCKDGSSFAGQWKEGSFNGYGCNTYPANSSAIQFLGQFAENQAEGWGVCTYTDGSKFSGEWKDGAQHGLGHQEATQPGGRFRYVGSFHEGVRQGMGIALLPAKQEYSGEVMCGVPHGYGVARLKGRKGFYAGQWREGRRHGWAVSTLLNGTLWAGQWVFGRACWLADMSLIMDSDLADDVLEALDLCQEAANCGRVAGRRADLQAQDILDESMHFQKRLRESCVAAEKAVSKAKRKALRAQRLLAKADAAKDRQHAAQLMSTA